MKKAPFIVLAGLDGSGKSTVLSHLQQHTWPTPIQKVVVGTRRPGVLQPLPPPGPMHEEGGNSHYSKPNHGYFKSLGKLTMMSCDWLVGYWWKLRPQKTAGALLLFDRHYLIDLAIDPARYRYGGPTWAVKLAQKVTPRPDLVIFLDVSEEVSQARKQERGAENFAEQRQAYLATAQQETNWLVVDASQPLPAVLQTVEQAILEKIGSRQ